MERERPCQVIAPRLSMRVWLRDLWTFRSVLAALCLRDIRGKYKQAGLGVAWALVQPIVQVGVFTLVFRGVANVATPVPYPIFALTALLPFNLFQQIVSLGTPAFVSAQGIVTKVYFPRLYTILAGSASAVLNAGITLVILLVAAISFGMSFSPRALLAAPMLLGVLLLAVGTASLLGALNARFRDVQHALPLLMTVLLYVSPVLYPLDSVPASLRPLAFLNPVTGLVDGFRALALGVPFHSWEAVASSLTASVVVFTLGVWVFERTQARLIDLL